MKRSIIILALLPLLAIVSVSCSAHSRLLKDAAAVKDVTSVYVGKMMLKLGTSFAGQSYAENFNVNELISDLNSIEVVETDSKKACAQLRTVFDNIVASNNCEIISEVNDTEGNDVDIVRIYLLTPDEKNKHEGILIATDEGSDFTIVFLSGKIDLEKLAGSIDASSTSDSSDM